MVSLMIKMLQAIPELCRLQNCHQVHAYFPSVEIAYRIFNPLFPYIHFSMDFVMLLMIYHSQKYIAEAFSIRSDIPGLKQSLDSPSYVTGCSCFWSYHRFQNCSATFRNCTNLEVAALKIHDVFSVSVKMNVFLFSKGLHV